MARNIGVHRSTISREVQRNAYLGIYNAHRAQVFAVSRKFFCGSQFKNLWGNELETLKYFRNREHDHRDRGLTYWRSDMFDDYTRYSKPIRCFHGGWSYKKFAMTPHHLKPFHFLKKMKLFKYYLSSKFEEEKKEAELSNKVQAQDIRDKTQRMQAQLRKAADDKAKHPEAYTEVDLLLQETILRAQDPNYQQGKQTALPKAAVA